MKTKSSVNYGPGGDHCGVCAFFEPDRNECQLVEGDIRKGPTRRQRGRSGSRRQQAAFRAADIAYYTSRRALELSFGFATVDTDAALAGLRVGPVPAN